MAKSLAEYAAQHPPQDAPIEPIGNAGKTMNERKEEWSRADELRASILRQIQSGQEPSIILYTALQCIGIYSADQEWMEAATKALDSVYEDLAQQSFTADVNAMERERLDALQAAEREKIRNYAKREKRRLDSIVKALTALEGAAAEPFEEMPL